VYFLVNKLRDKNYFKVFIWLTLVQPQSLAPSQSSKRFTHGKPSIHDVGPEGTCMIYHRVNIINLTKAAYSRKIYFHISHEDLILHVAPLLQNHVRHVGNPDSRNSGSAALVWPPITKCRPTYQVSWESIYWFERWNWRHTENLMTLRG